jgi:hypothetical protein
MDRLDIIKAVDDQIVIFSPPEGRPDATPEVELKTIGGSIITAASTTDVEIDPCDVEVAMPAAPGATSLELDDVSDVVVGREYLATNALGQRERLTVIGVDVLTDIVYLDEPIEYAYDALDPFVGTMFWRELQSDEVAELAELNRARAVYEVGGLTHVLEVPFDIVLTPLPNVLTVALLKLYRPGLTAQEHAETRGSDFGGLREAAWDRVRKGIRRAGYRPALLRTPDDVEEWALAELDLLLEENGVRVLRGDWPPTEALKELRERRNIAKAACLATLQFMDLDESDSRGAGEECPGRLAFIR